MRSIFCVKEPYVMLGADLKQIEAVMTAHYASFFDDGKYIKVLQEAGSIHEYNAAMLGIDKDTAKSFQFSVFFGARAPKVASILNCPVKKADKLITNFWNGTPGVRDLVDYLSKYYKKHGFIKGLDGRKIFIRAEYKLLNSLIQTAAGIVFKKWCNLANRSLREENLDCKQVIQYHDELEFRCNNNHLEESKLIVSDAALRAGEYFKIRMPVLVDVKSGANWSEVH